MSTTLSPKQLFVANLIGCKLHQMLGKALGMETTKKRSLLDISEDLHALDELLFENGGDVSDSEVEKAIADWFAEVEQDEQTKVGNYIGLIREKELRASAIEAEIERYMKLLKALTNSAKGLKERLKFYMELNQKKKIETSRGNATVCKNGGKQPLTIDELVDPEKVETCFQKVEIKIDTDKVRKALEDGKEVEFAKLEQRGTHLRIR